MRGDWIAQEARRHRVTREQVKRALQSCEVWEARGRFTLGIDRVFDEPVDENEWVRHHVLTRFDGIVDPADPSAGVDLVHEASGRGA